MGNVTGTGSGKSDCGGLVAVAAEKGYEEQRSLRASLCRIIQETRQTSPDAIHVLAILPEQILWL